MIPFLLNIKGTTVKPVLNFSKSQLSCGPASLALCCFLFLFIFQSSILTFILMSYLAISFSFTFINKRVGDYRMEALTCWHFLFAVQFSRLGYSFWNSLNVVLIKYSVNMRIYWQIQYTFKGCNLSSNLVCSEKSTYIGQWRLTFI